jgi:YVTN family beta-propeller protein
VKRNLCAAVGAGLTAAALAACGSSNFSSPTPLPAAPLTGTQQSRAASSTSLPAAQQNLYVANSGNNTVTVYAAGGTSVLRTISEGIAAPIALAFDNSANLYVANRGSSTITEYASGGS